MFDFGGDPEEEIYRIVGTSLGTLTTSEVAARSSYSKATVLKYLKKLNRKGRINRKTQGNTYYWYTGSKSLF